MFDIEQIEAKDEFTLSLVGADEAPLMDADNVPLSVTVYGPGSKQYAAAQAERNQRLMDRMAKKGRTKMTAEEQAAENARFLAACTKSFNGWQYRGSATDFEGAYANSRLGFISDQVARAVSDWANFSGGSATS